MTGKDIIEVLKGIENYRVRDFAHEGLYYVYNKALQAYEDQLGEVNEVERYGGEDMGSTWYVVYYFPKHDVYIKVDGWYQSYHGVEFEDWDSACREVKLVEKVVKVYE